MKLTYLGTAAAEGYPALFCRCKNCTDARTVGGRSIRSRSQTLINDDLLIDFPEDAYYHAVQNNLSFADIRAILITHTHSDHLDVENFAFRNWISAHLNPEDILTVYGSQDIVNPITQMVGNPKPPNGAYVQVLPLWETTQIVGGYYVTALKANHGTENPYIYIIEKDGKKLLYAHDTGLFPQETLQYLEKTGIRFDMVSLDCNDGTAPMDYTSHMNMQRCDAMVKAMRQYGNIDDKTILCLNHFSHNSQNTLYHQLEPIAKEHGYLCSYDGMSIEF